MTLKTRQTATWLFEALPRHFDNENYGDWEEIIHIKIIYTSNFTLFIENGVAQTCQGLNGTPTGTLTLTLEAFIGAINNRKMKNEYLSKGLITTTDKEIFKKFFRAFNFSVLKNIYKEIPIRILLKEEPRKGFAEIHKQYEERFKKFFRRKLGFGDLHQEAYHCWFLELMESIPKFRWETTLLSWCYLIARSSLNKILREVIENKGLEQISPTMISKIADKNSFNTLKHMHTNIKESFVRLQDDILTTNEREIMKHIIKNLNSWKETASITLSSDPDYEKYDRESHRLKKIVQKMLEINSWQPEDRLSCCDNKLLLQIAQKITFKTKLTENNVINLLQQPDLPWSKIVTKIYTRTPRQILIDREAARLRGLYGRTKIKLKNEAEKRGLIDRKERQKELINQ